MFEQQLMHFLFFSDRVIRHLDYFDLSSKVLTINMNVGDTIID